MASAVPFACLAPHELPKPFSADATCKTALGQPDSGIRFLGLGKGGWRNSIRFATGVLMANGREISFRCCAIVTPRSEANVSVRPHHPEPAHAARGLARLG
jgi:hypothetical protein